MMSLHRIYLLIRFLDPNMLQFRRKHQRSPPRCPHTIGQTGRTRVTVLVLVSRRPPRPGCGAFFRKAATRKPTKAQSPETRNSKPQTLKLKP